MDPRAIAWRVYRAQIKKIIIPYYPLSISKKNKNGEIMDEKTVFALATNLMLGGVLIASWSFGKDGVISTAIFGLIGVVSGTILGFKFGKAE